MEYTKTENLENGKARMQHTEQLQMHEGILDDEQLSYYTMISCQSAIVNVDEQRIGQNNLDTGINRPPRNRKLYN